MNLHCQILETKKFYLHKKTFFAKKNVLVFESYLASFLRTGFISLYKSNPPEFLMDLLLPLSLNIL